MFDNDLELDIEQELSEIPPEYQDAFRQAIERELAETEQNRTDTDILTYLRSRRDDFQRGGFIRPDGRPGWLPSTRRRCTSRRCRSWPRAVWENRTIRPNGGAP